MTVVKDIDRGMRAMVRRFTRYRRGPHVAVGIQSTEAALKRAFNQTNVTLAVVHEFGSRDGKIPQRSFMRSTVDRERMHIEKLLSKVSHKTALQAEDITRTLGKVGEYARAEMVRTIDQSIGLKPKAAATLRRHPGKTTPLIVEGILKRSITWRVYLK